MVPAPRSTAAPETGRRTGTLSLFLSEEPAGPRASGPSQDKLQAVGRPPYARFRLCRGFIDDLNHILPIRIRIQLEGEIAKGRKRGQVEGPSLRFHWEFLEA